MKKILIGTINLYQKTISPDHGPLRKPHGYCRYYPTCSEYTKRSIAAHGSLRGLAKGAHRVARCHPWAAGGIDESYKQRQILGSKKKELHV